MDAEPIKTCGYCGRENASNVLNCRECGTALEQEQPGEIRQVLKSSWAKSSATIAIATGLAAFLISTGVFCLSGRTSVEPAPLPYNPLIPGETIMYPSREIISYNATVGRLLMLAIIVFTIAACWIRCHKRWQAILAAAITLGIMAMIPFVPGCLILMPAFALGMTLDSFALFYITAAFQIVIGVLLLYWFRRPKLI
jgi:hypothetical protein